MGLFLALTAFSCLNLSYASSFDRRQSLQPTLPGNWSFQGCFTDNVDGGRTLAAATFTNTTSMTVESCVNFCNSQNFIYAGLEFAQECYCDNTLEHGGNITTATDCNMPCTGNSTEICGAGNRLSLYWSGATPPPPPVEVKQVGNWTSLGCYSDNVDGRALPVGMQLSTPNTIEECTSVCFNAGYQFAGTEFSDECYCGTAIVNGGAKVPNDSDCDMLCSGNSSEFCGGPNRLSVYNYTGTNLPPITAPVGGGGGGGGNVPVFPVLSGLPKSWSYNACYVDNAFGRIAEFEVPGDQTTNMTVESCIAACVAQNYTVAGMEFSDQCFCGDRLVNGAVAADDSTCNMGCAGNATEACGGPNRLSVYSSLSNFTILPVPSVQKTNLPTDWTYAGCYVDTDVHVLPNKIVLGTNNTVDTCVSLCDKFGYSAAGVEFGDECYCGDIEDIQTQSNSTSESDCNVSCAGDPIHLCGGGLRLTTYFLNVTRNVWHTPANTGWYEFFVPGVTVPLLITVGINNKVTFLEKWGTGFPNETGAYELDLSLSNNFSAMWREMHVKTDVFCSGSIVLPDKGGRVINVGGWSLDSTFGIRLYTPDGSPGVNGTNDWEENGDELQLQRGRWYPTAAMLPNGSILVIGGETGSNAAPQPNLEILPFPEGGQVVELDWLNRTDPWNLYPFVVVLPSGNLFVAYYNEARIIDSVNFNTVKVLPNIPGAVTDQFGVAGAPLGGRTYPLEGSAVVFPQHAPYTDPLRVLLCGGSTGPGPAFPLDNCVSIEPEVENATWTVERMPSTRVMPCMAGLPDGTFFIANGAHEGVAGFGLASDPNLVALLYDPIQPVYQRMSILNTTIVPRLYHSETTLLPDGRVMISGSDPQTPGFNEEFRVEVYIPPYLSQGLTPPTFNISETDWAYGGQYTISNIKLHQGNLSNLKISLVFGTSSTHGNTMGARTIFPAFSCSGTSCTITAPPNAFISPPGWHQLFILDGPTPSHSAWVRIGGDPAQLGNWPNLPGFTVPGV